MSQHARVVQVDVFTDEPLTGNPAAVVLDAEAMNGDMMQRIAREMNLSETVFVLPATEAEADYRVRIFTPRAELDFAGHPTIGTAHALAETGRIPGEGTVVQECGAGLVPVAISGGVYTLTSPPPTFTPSSVDEAQISRLLGCDPADVLDLAHVDVGVGWTTVRCVTAAVVSGLQPDLSGLEREALDVTVFGHEPGIDARERVRSFAPAHGIAEDPVCGSGNACVAAMLLRSGDLAPGDAYTAVQGDECGRPGRVNVDVTAEGRIRIGGRAVSVMHGELVIPDPDAPPRRTG